jgi:hypothetical protein
MIACTSASAKRQGGGSHRNGARQGRRQAQLPQPLAAWLQRGPRMAGKLGKSKGGRHAKRPALSLPIDIGANAITPAAGWPPRRGAGRPVARTSALMTPFVAGEDRGNRPGRGAPLHSRSHDATRAHRQQGHTSSGRGGGAAVLAAHSEGMLAPANQDGRQRGDRHRSLK